MTFTFTMVDRDSGQTANVHVDGDTGRAVREVVAEAERLLATDVTSATGPATYFVGERPLDLDASIAASGVRDGVVVSRSAEAVPPPPVRALSLGEVRIVSGPHAGTVVRADAGIVTIGSGAAAQLRVEAATQADGLADAAAALGGQGVPDIALLVSVGPDGATVRPVNGYAGAALDGDPVVTETAWAEDAQLTIGSALLAYGRPRSRGAHLALAEDGMALEYNRPPRILPPDDHARYQLPVPPVEPPARALPILMALAPMGMAVMFVSTTGRWIYLLVALLSPLVMVITGLQGRRQGKKTHRQRVAEYEDTRARIEADATESLRRERARWIASAPDPADVYETAVGPLPRLWERRPTDPDHLLVRVGTATQRSEVTLEDPEQLSHKRTVTWDARDVPVRIELAERGVLGIAGPGDDARRIANWVVAQLATLQSPKDLTFALLTDSTRTGLWEWMSWLPHVRRDGADQPVTSIASTAAGTARLIAELSATIDARKEAGVRAGRQAQHAGQIVVVMDGARRLRAMPSLVQVLKEGPAVGVFSICLDLDERLLPEECDAVVVIRDGRLRVRQQRSERIDDARPDLVDQDWLEWVARSLSPIVDASPDVEDGAVPSSSRLLDVLALEPPTSEAVQARWTLGGRSTTAVIGESIDGAFAIDLHRDGPHGLVAGTTGSGKSELLQSLVASLAVANRPDEMVFVLVDYKGGAAFKDCVDLPHTVGMVTDLDTHQVERALESLGAELRRREHALAAVGAKDLEDHQDLRAKRAAAGDASVPSLPRLVIVIDEFASLARELPDFVKGLVNVAQRGRSLGIHLVLATQRPGGVVSPEIRANTNIRIALRVTDQSESQDVIGANDAARIAKTTPGRAYVRLGAASLLPFQTGRVGGRRPGGVGDDADVAPLVRERSFADLSEPAPRRAATASDLADVEVTDLSVLVRAVGDAAMAIGVPEQRKPWLPPLPSLVTLADVEAVSAVTAPLAVAWGLEDHPDRQEQRPLVFDLDQDGHLFVIGSPRSGRSQALRTLAGAMALRLGVGDVHLYGIDCGNGALLPIGALPHCGAVVQRHEPERVARLVTTLLGLVRTRQTAFARGGYGSIAEQREAAPAADEVPMPHVVVLLDQWEGFMSSLAEVENGALHDAVQTLLREGVGVGVHLVVTGDRTLTAGRMSSQVERKLLLALADRGDYAYEGVNGKKLPEIIPPGRGFRNATATETQIAVLPGGATGRAQADALRGIGDEVRALVAADAPRPVRVDALPQGITRSEAVRYLPVADARAGRIGVGVGGDELRFHTHDFVDDTAVFVVAGSARSGKSTTLVAMARHALDTGGSVVAVVPRDSPLRALAAEQARCTVFTDPGLSADDLAAAVEGAEGFTLVLVDDAELLKETDAEPVFRAIMASERGRRVGLVLGGDVEGVASGFRGWQVDAKKARRGLLLAPLSTVDGDLIGARLTKSALGQDRMPGRGLLHDADGVLRVVQVPEGD
ncbi:FtsK/SpoIIIE domain-containing protein [Curtobacterium sp. MCBD17_003]|uniref:FtsK/SpoIIIE domain-containing protein n=1 Tax=Curtobacterium sp. MCBD17_003 TaxID=2175667 RepID=UPI000DA8057C|nr:FtsK/SpoIIIE domain-containing protein [Curtobacterium sp. MCBD17_003]WIE55021.1 FtsK/SpoIIIE domain-containing protein [Curtobacterium sp. MCBD17_003]